MLAFSIIGIGASGGYLLSRAHSYWKYLQFKREGFDGTLSRANGKVQSKKPGVSALVINDGLLELDDNNDYVGNRCRVDREVDEWKTRTIWVSSGKTMIPVVQNYVETVAYPEYDRTVWANDITLKNLNLNLDGDVRMCVPKNELPIHPAHVFRGFSSLGLDTGKEAKQYIIRQSFITNYQQVTAVGHRKGNNLKVSLIGSSEMVHKKMRKCVYGVRYGRITTAASLLAGSVWLAYQNEDDLF